MVDSRFVGFLTETTWVPQWFSLESVGSTMENLNTGILGRLPLPCPPLEEQVTLVHKLIDMIKVHDTACSQLEVSVNRLLEYRQAVITSQLEIPVEDNE